jgi:hypothetical protein
LEVGQEQVELEEVEQGQEQVVEGQEQGLDMEPVVEVVGRELVVEDKEVEEVVVGMEEEVELVEGVVEVVEQEVEQLVVGQGVELQVVVGHSIPWGILSCNDERILQGSDLEAYLVGEGEAGLVYHQLEGT